MYKMDFFDQPYYRETKMLLSWAGHWPFHSTLRRHIIVYSSCFVMISQMAAKTAFLFTSYDDADLVFDSLPMLLGNLGSVIKTTTYYLKSKELKELLNCVKIDWSTTTTDKEAEILHRYAERGRQISQYYARLLGITLSASVVVPVAPSLLFGVGNTSHPLPHHVNYFVDTDEYYYPILLHAYVASFLYILAVVAADTMFIILIQHACGVFALIAYRLEHIVEAEGLNGDIFLPLTEDKYYLAVRDCVQQHISVLSFMEVMESLYNVTFLVQSGVNMFIISVTAVRASTTIDAPQILARHLVFALAVLSHLIFECYQAQKIIDHSLHIEKSLANLRWYLTSFRTRKLVNFMLLRSHIPTEMTAGKLFVISMEFCSTVLRTSASYFTVLSSTR